MTNIVFLRLVDPISLFSDVDASVDVVVIPLRQLAGSPADITTTTLNKRPPDLSSSKHLQNTSTTTIFSF